MASVNGIKSEQARSHANSKGWLEYLADLSKSIKDKPGNMRTVLKGVISAGTGIGILVELSLETQNALDKVRFADRIINVLRVPGIIDTWVHYDYDSIGRWDKLKPVIFAKEIANSILALASIPQLLDKLQLINLSNTIGRVPVLRLFVSLPGTILLSVLNLFVSSIDIALSTIKIVKIQTGASQTKIDAKKAFWTAMKDSLNARGAPNLDDKPSVKKAYDNFVSSLQEKEISQPTERANGALLLLAQKKIDKWNKKELMQKQIVTKEAINIVFQIILIALTVFALLAALALTFTGLGLLMTLLGLALSCIGIYKLCDDLFNPVPNSVSPKSVLSV